MAIDITMNMNMIFMTMIMVMRMVIIMNKILIIMWMIFHIMMTMSNLIQSSRYSDIIPLQNNTGCITLWHSLESLDQGLISQDVGKEICVVVISRFQPVSYLLGEDLKEIVKDYKNNMIIDSNIILGQLEALLKESSTMGLNSKQLLWHFEK